MQHKRSGVRVAVIVFLLAALFWEHVPTIGGQSVIRAAILSEDAGVWTVGLIDMEPGSAADSAEAKEQMKAYWGSGKSFSQALLQAEAALPGRANYKLCNHMLVCGIPTTAFWENISDAVSDSGKGRLAARVTLCTAPISVFRAKELDISTLYANLANAAQDAPRLYQAAQRQMLVPVYSEADSTLEAAGLACLTRDSAVFLPQGEASAAWLLWNGSRTIQAEWQDTAVTIQAWISYATDARNATLQVYGLVRGLPQEKNLRAELLHTLQNELQEKLETVQRRADSGGGDLLHRDAFAAMTGREKQPLQWKIQLWAEN